MGGGTGCGCCGREGDVVVEKGSREREANKGTHRENGHPKPLAWKMRGAEDCEFLQPVELKALRFKGQ